MSENNKLDEKRMAKSVAIITLIGAIIGLISSMISYGDNVLSVAQGLDSIIPFGSEITVKDLENQKYEKIDAISEADVKNEEEVWQLIKIKFMLEEYEEVIQLAEDNNLLDTEKMLNVLGVMYANGFYYEQDYDTAVQYFKAAAEYGESDDTFLNLWLASYEMDLAEENEYFYYNNTYEAVLIGKKKENETLNRLLIANIDSGEIENDGYTYVQELSGQERDEFFAEYAETVGSHKYLVCTEYDYYADENNELVAVAKCIEERSIPYRVYRKGSPSKYIVFDDFEVVAKISERTEVTAKFEYETSYISDDGGTYLWVDTDEIYCGEEPPKDTEDSRWVITSYEEGNQNKRRFRKQVKR